MVVLLAACSVQRVARSPAPAQPPPQLVSVEPQARAALAPEGRLRVGVVAGSPLSLVGRDEAHYTGVGYELGKELARWLDVPFELVQFDRPEDVIAAMKLGEVDFTVTYVSNVYGRDVNYSLPLLDLEQGYLTVNGKLREIGDINALTEQGLGVRIGVMRGASASAQATLTRRHPQAQMVPLASYAAAADALAARRLDLLAASKSVLYPMADRLSGARVLEGRWGLETVAVAIPKGRQAGMAYLTRFVLSVRREGFLQTAIRRSGLKGAVEPAIK
jgi:polar amino acid transport system substrate-binding protein